MAVPRSRARDDGPARDRWAAASRYRAEAPTDRFEPVTRRRSTRGGPPRRPPARRRRGVAATTRLLAAAAAMLVVSGTGFAYYSEKGIDGGFSRSGVVSAEDAAALDGDMNILLIGLDTRRDKDGNLLPKDILDQLHAGDGTEGGYNANSLILLHIPKDLKKITAFSIPRDDYVAVNGIPGYDHAKIKETYGLKKAATEDTLAAQGVKDPVELEHRGREAGRESVLQAVKALTGVPINRVAEIALVGFYHLAGILGGVDVCLNQPVDDSDFSGAVFPAGRQHLYAAQSLAFVRQRHELENEDLDRTHRQQAFLTSAAKQLKDAGTLTNIGKLQSLIKAAQDDVVLSDGWNVLDFAQTLGRAGSIPVEFQTLPIQGYDTVNDQAVNVVDPAVIRKIVRTAFGMQAAPPSTPKATPTSTVDVVNAGSASGMAAKVSTALSAKGFGKGNATTADDYGSGGASAIAYGSGADADATRLSELLGGPPAHASTDVAPGRIRLVLGADFTLPGELSSAATTSGSSGGGTSASAATADALPDSGKPVTTTIGSDIPCVN
ncbi:LCP family protein [Nocardia terpenica]|uniref:LCP family protein n=1 Tax=Nocardia terpenica TaxID=455432 RepID=UPI00189405D7|nr:LCP family protein [Nocardia terpenica]MBF6059366.1 LCP family protein [Nocardia terpenica]MBF6103095.1 LCP family protein [Nocardia terpenica]MBF6110716.1 LCP family protein [Nocardia terpenica]MBF6116847.1 LCP family protein [Nocardia terpenica]